MTVITWKCGHQSAIRPTKGNNNTAPDHDFARMNVCMPCFLEGKR